MTTQSGDAKVQGAGALFLDAEALYRELLQGVRALCTPQTRLVGITSGGAWLAERMQKDLQLPGEAGSSRRPCIAMILRNEGFHQVAKRCCHLTSKGPKSSCSMMFSTPGERSVR